MHDIDLIPTDALVRLRDEKRKPRGAKLMKDAAQKAVQTKQLNRALLKEAAKEAATTRRARALAKVAHAGSK